MLVDYWWVAGIALLPAIFFILRHLAWQRAKVIALQWIAVAERTLFVEGDSKIAFVSQKAYSLLPPKVKVFIPYAAFNILVRGLYDEVKFLIQEMHQKIAAQTPTTKK